MPGIGLNKDLRKNHATSRLLSIVVNSRYQV